MMITSIMLSAMASLSEPAPAGLYLSPGWILLGSIIIIFMLYLLISSSQRQAAQRSIIEDFCSAQLHSGLTYWQYYPADGNLKLWGLKEEWFPESKTTTAPFCYKLLEFEKNIHPEDKEVILSVLSLRKTAHNLDNKVIRLRGSDSTHYKWHYVKILSSQTLTRDRDDYFSGYMEDITEQQKLKLESESKLEEYKFIVDNANCIILRWDEDGLVTYFNNYAEKFFGYKSEEVMGRHLVGTIVPETESHGRDLRHLIDQITKNPDRFTNNINENIKRNGERAWIAWNNRIYTITQKGKEVLSTGFDITKLLAAEDALRENEREKMTILNSISEGVIFIGTDGNIRWCNEAAAKITGAEIDSITGTSCQEFFGYINEDSQDYSCTAERAMRTRKECHFTGSLPNGTIITLTAVPVFNNGEVCGVVETFADITQQSELEQQLRYSQKMDAVGQLAGGIAHDFNNKLCGLLGFAQLLSDTMLNSDQQRYLNTIIECGECCSELTGQLLAFARKGKFNVEVVDLNEKIEYLISFLKHSINPLVAISTDLCPQPAIVDGDDSQLSNMLLNLAVNANDAMEDGGELTITTEIKHLDLTPESDDWNGLTPGKYIRIEIRDTGCGIPEDILPRVFDPFFSTKEASEGSGMGLAAVYGIVTSHNGRINIESEIGLGTTIIIYLPFSKAGQSSSIQAELPLKILSDIKILIIEDETINQLLLEEELTKMGYNVTIASDGHEGVALFRQNRYDIVLLDMVMPRLNGRDAFYEIRDIDPQARIIIISGYEVDNTIREILAAGALDFIPKPFERKEISQSIIRALNYAPDSENIIK